MSECDFEGCDNDAISYGLCNGHRQQRDKGKPLRPLRKVIRKYDSEWDLVAPKLTPNAGGCLEWGGHLSSRKYGKIGATHGYKSTHVVAWERVHGPVPAGMVVNHLCGNTKCANVKHLEMTTYAENAAYQTRINVRNTSGYRGVFQRKKDGRWCGTVQRHGKRYRSHGLDTPKEANDWVIAKRASLGMKDFNEWREENLVEVSQ